MLVVPCQFAPKFCPLCIRAVPPLSCTTLQANCITWSEATLQKHLIFNIWQNIWSIALTSKSFFIGIGISYTQLLWSIVEIAAQFRRTISWRWRGCKNGGSWCEQWCRRNLGARCVAWGNEFVNIFDDCKGYLDHWHGTQGEGGTSPGQHLI